MDEEVGEICVKTSSPLSLHWNIPNFFSRLQKLENFNSPQFPFCNQMWRLLIWKHSNSSEFMNLLLTDNPVRKHCISYEVSVIDADGRESTNMRNESLLKKIFITLYRFPTCTKLIQNRSNIALHGTWTITCVLRCAYHLVQSQPVTVVEVRKNGLNEDNGRNSMKDDTICSTKKEVIPAILDEEDLKDENANNSGGKEDSICGTKKEVSPDILDFERLLRDMEALFFNGKGSDVTLIVQDRKFPAHTSILGARSTVFDAMFSHDVVETATGVVKITDIDPDVFHDFLLYLYSAKVERLSVEKAIGLYSAADKYDIQELKAKCAEFMRDNLSLDMFCSVISLALQHQESCLLEAATKFFVENLTQIIVTVEWQEFLKENSAAANELLIKASSFYVPPKQKK